MLGALLVSESDPGPRLARIVEVEAYVGLEDHASHAHRGRTERNAVMFGPPGRAYVYLVYGMYECLNVVTQAQGTPAAVLVRAVEAVSGAEAMRQSRIDRLIARGRNWPADRLGRERVRIAGLPEARLASGPGLVCAAMSIGRNDNGGDLCDPSLSLRLERDELAAGAAVESGPRVGIGYAPEPWLSNAWRFWLAGNAAVSR